MFLVVTWYLPPPHMSTATTPCIRLCSAWSKSLEVQFNASVLASSLLFSRPCVAEHLLSTSVPHSTSLYTHLCIARSKGPIKHSYGRFLFVVLMPMCSMVQQPVAFLSAPLHPLLLNTMAPWPLRTEKDNHLHAHGASGGVFIISNVNIVALYLALGLPFVIIGFPPQ
ncbi:hypothetical protein LguiB_012638 [Lonicera macranthoides]